MINSNNDLDFLGWIIKTYYLPVSFSQSKIYLCWRTLAAFWRWCQLLQRLSTNDNGRNLCQDLLTIENTDLDLKVQGLHYANELLERVRLSFQTLEGKPQCFSIFYEVSKGKKSKTDKEFCFLAFLLVICRKIWQTGSKTMYIEFKFAGINMFWVRLRLILARAVSRVWRALRK